MTDDNFDDPGYDSAVGEIELTLEDGDDFENIARAFETSVEVIARLNPEVNITQEVTAGQQIRVPYRRCPSGTIYTVRRGDTLYSIAARYGITEAALRQANPLLTGVGIRPGLPLCIPQRRPAACPGGFIHTIAARDSLFRIASRYGTTVAAILRANPGLDPNRLFAGQRICIPVTPSPVPPPIPPRPERCPGGFFHTITAGDTLFNLATRFNITVEAIIRANPGINLNRLFPGQRICIPGRMGPRATEVFNNMDYTENTYYPEGMY